jgi:hypothetical protein
VRRRNIKLLFEQIVAVVVAAVVGGGYSKSDYWSVSHCVCFFHLSGYDEYKKNI